MLHLSLTSGAPSLGNQDEGATASACRPGSEQLFMTGVDLQCEIWCAAAVAPVNRSQIALTNSVCQSTGLPKAAELRTVRYTSAPQCRLFLFLCDMGEQWFEPRADVRHRPEADVLHGHGFS